MAATFGLIHASAYSRFWLGIWALLISAVFTLVAFAGLLVSRFSGRTPSSTTPVLMSARVAA
jgi:hypothetical protein